MGVYIAFTDSGRPNFKGPNIGGVLLDLTTDEEYVYDSEVPSHTVEEGYSVQDNVQQKPFTLSLTGKVSPYGLFEERDFAYADVALENLKLVQSNKEPIAVSTGLDYFPSMILKTIKVVRNKSNTNLLEVALDLLEIKKTDYEVITIEKIKPEAAKTLPMVKGGDTITLETLSGEKVTLANKQITIDQLLGG